MSVRYQRQMPVAAPGDDDAEDYIRPREVIDPDEESFVALIRNAALAEARSVPKHAGKNDPTFHEPHWGHGTGLLQGTLTIDRIDALPARFRVGLFANNESFPVVCRPNFQDDKKAGYGASRMSVKVK